MIEQEKENRRNGDDEEASEVIISSNKLDRDDKSETKSSKDRIKNHALKYEIDKFGLAALVCFVPGIYILVSYLLVNKYVHSHLLIVHASILIGLMVVAIPALDLYRSLTAAQILRIN